MDSTRFDYQKNSADALFYERQTLTPAIRFAVPILGLLVILFGLVPTLRNALVAGNFFYSFMSALITVFIILAALFVYFVNQEVIVTREFVMVNTLPLDPKPDRVPVDKLDEVESRPAAWMDAIGLGKKIIPTHRYRYLGGTHVAHLVMGCDWRLSVGTNDPEGLRAAVENAKKGPGETFEMVE